nr:DNA polymerase III subunit delta [Actinomycetota bacterium]
MSPAKDVGEPGRAVLVQGDDPSLVSQALSRVVDGLAGGDRGPTPVEEYGEPGRGDHRADEPAPVALALAACRTPPFLAERRVVVLRDASSLDASQAKALVAYLAEPLDTTVLVIAHSGRSAPAALVKAVRAVGTVLDAVPATSGRARSEWLSERLRTGPVRLSSAAASRLAEHLGEDLSRLDGILGALAATYGPKATVAPEDLEPFLGEAGAVAPWDLTDALDGGDAARAVVALRRLLGAGGRHPLQVLATLQRHYGAILRLDGSGAADESVAAELTGLAPYPARKALSQARRLGHERVARAVTLLSGADLDVRGGTGWPPDLVLEVLVARLAHLVRERPGAR